MVVWWALWGLCSFMVGLWLLSNDFCSCSSRLLFHGLDGGCLLQATLLSSCVSFQGVLIFPLWVDKPFFCFSLAPHLVQRATQSQA